MSPCPVDQPQDTCEASPKSRAAHEHKCPSEHHTSFAKQPSPSAESSITSNSAKHITIKASSAFQDATARNQPNTVNHDEYVQHLAGPKNTVSAVELGIRPDAPAVAGAPAHPFPCQKSDNCNDQRIDETSEQEKLKAKIRYQLKAAVTLSCNVNAFIKMFGLENIGFMTLTLEEHLDWRIGKEWQEAQRRFHSLMSGYMKSHFSASIAVLEPQHKNEWRIHWHLLINVGFDIRKGFDFEAVNKKDYRSANPALRALWKELRKTLPHYGFGRAELLPLKKEAKAVADYLGKYLSKDGWRAALSQKFKARRVRYSRGWTVANMRWSWNNEGGRKWRRSLRMVAEAVECYDLEQFQLLAKAKFGSKWAYHLRDIIIKLGDMLEAGLDIDQFKMIVRSMIDLDILPPYIITDYARDMHITK